MSWLFLKTSAKSRARGSRTTLKCAIYMTGTWHINGRHGLRRSARAARPLPDTTSFSRYTRPFHRKVRKRRWNWLGASAMRPGKKRAFRHRSSIRCWFSPVKSHSTRKRSILKFDRAMWSPGWKLTAIQRWKCPVYASWKRCGARPWPRAPTGLTHSRHQLLTAS